MTEISEDVVRDMFGFTAPSEAQLNSISRWATKALELKAHIDIVEEQLKELKSELFQIETIDLANVLINAGIEEFTLQNGSKIVLKDVIRNGLSKDPEVRQFTFDWVIENGGKEIIKDHFEIDFNKGSYDRVKLLRSLLQENNMHYDEIESIHVQTLWAFLREKMEEMKKTKKGELPPFEEMGLYYGKHAEVKPAKVKNEN